MGWFNSGPKKAGWGAIAVTLIAGFEGLYTYAYRDVVGVKTVCYGHIENVKMGDHYTPEQCKQMLLDDLPRYDACVQKAIHVRMPDHRHAAILSFTYNVGCGALQKSSVARKLNQGDVQGGCHALLLYNKAGGRVIKGLDNRRHAELKECLRSD
jgi:lysozyme